MRFPFVALATFLSGSAVASRLSLPRATSRIGSSAPPVQTHYHGRGLLRGSSPTPSPLIEHDRRSTSASAGAAALGSLAGGFFALTYGATVVATGGGGATAANADGDANAGRVFNIDARVKYARLKVDDGVDLPFELSPMSDGECPRAVVNNERYNLVEVTIEGVTKKASDTIANPAYFYSHIKNQSVTRILLLAKMAIPRPPAGLTADELSSYHDQAHDAADRAYFASRDDSAKLMLLPSHERYVEKVDKLLRGTDQRPGGFYGKLTTIPERLLHGADTDLKRLREMKRQNPLARQIVFDSIGGMGEIPAGDVEADEEAKRKISQSFAFMRRSFRYKVNANPDEAGAPEWLILQKTNAYRPKSAAVYEDDSDKDDEGDNGDDNEEDNADEANGRVTQGNTPNQVEIKGNKSSAGDGRYIPFELNALTPSLFMDDSYAALFDFNNPKHINLITDLFPNAHNDAMKKKMRVQGTVHVVYDELIARETSCAGTKRSALLVVAGESARMYPIKDQGPHGLGYHLPWGWRCDVTFTRLCLVENGWLPARPRSSQFEHGWFEEAQDGQRTYRMVKTDRIVIATHGSANSAISRGRNGWNTKDLEYRIRCMVVCQDDMVRASPRLAEFTSLLGGGWWRCTTGVIYRRMERDTVAKWLLAATLVGNKHRVIDLLSARLAEEVEEGNLPEQKVVFAACATALDGDGRRRTAAIPFAGELKGDDYWSAIRPFYEERRQDPAKRQGNTNASKNLLFRAGQAVMDLDKPIFIAIPDGVGGNLRYFYLFEDFLRYLVSKDLCEDVFSRFAPNLPLIVA